MPRDTRYTRELFFSQYEEICNSASDTLFHRGMDLFDKMDDCERLALCSNQMTFRLPKIVLVAVADCIALQYASDCIKQEIAKAKRINKNR